MDRKEFIKLTTFATLSQYLPSIKSNGEIMKRTIPSSKQQLSAVGLGTWIQFDVSKFGLEYQQLSQLLKEMHRLSGQMIDSSPMYGQAEERVGDLCSQFDFKNDFFYATKVWTSGKDNGIRQMQRSLQLMQRDYMDLMQIHNLLDWQTHLNTLKDWKEQGKIKYIGLTHYTDSNHRNLADIIKKEKEIDFIQFNYSIMDRHAEKFLIKTAEDHKVATIINRPYYGGSLFRSVKGKALPEWAKDYDISSWGQFFLKYILADPAITCVIPGTSKVKHLVDNMQAGYGRLPDQKMRKKMVEFIENL